MNARELREKTVDDLRAELLALQKESFNLRMQLSSQQLQQTHMIRQVRKNIARINTVITEKMGESHAE